MWIPLILDVKVLHIICNMALAVHVMYMFSLQASCVHIRQTTPAHFTNTKYVVNSLRRLFQITSI